MKSANLPCSLEDAISAVMSSPPKRYQVRGLRWMDRVGGRGLLADDMGLGKTYQSVARLAAHPDLRPAVVVCPQSLKYNWQNELRNFAGIESQVLEGRRRYKLEGEVWVLNYDIAEYWKEKLIVRQPKVIFLDECQMVKNPETIRAVACREIAAACEQVMGLSGTPIRNRPAEFFSVLNMIAPGEFESWEDYAFRYCNPVMGPRGKWDFRGSSNVEELHRRVKPYMLRRTKEEVLPELPKTQESYVPIKTNLADYRKARDSFVDWIMETRGAQKLKKAMKAERLVRTQELRRLVALAKWDGIVVWVKEWMGSNPGKKLVVYAIHREIVRRLRETFPNSVAVVGGMAAADRQAAVERFQNDPDVPLFFGSLTAAGVGITLVASDTVTHTEIGWVPGDHAQANDRVNRIGQTSKHVNAYYLVAKDTVEEGILRLHKTKKNVISQIIDGKKVEKVEDQIIELLIAEKAGKEVASAAGTRQQHHGRTQKEEYPILTRRPAAAGI